MSSDMEECDAYTIERFSRLPLAVKRATLQQLQAMHDVEDAQAKRGITTPSALSLSMREKRRLETRELFRDLPFPPRR